MEWRGREWSGREWSGGEGRAGQGRAGQGRARQGADCLGGLSRVGISSRSTRPWNGQPPSIMLCWADCHSALMSCKYYMFDVDILCIDLCLF